MDQYIHNEKCAQWFGNIKYLSGLTSKLNCGVNDAFAEENVEKKIFFKYN